MADMEELKKHLLSKFVESIDRSNENFRREIDNLMSSNEFKNMSQLDVVAAISKISSEVTYSGASGFAIQAIEEYHSWLTENFELKPKA
ncbi:hypothetical protein [Aneurinibacillus aneurinilyticus]|uniref:hypothetical protein n=1 Tax=Aneurinibacillus aneurinilyticus TaxID=1391 RepID=UPI0023F416BD|nr:hypothetical protein [Aneurinibacillus aneurinilyticus]